MTSRRSPRISPWFVQFRSSDEPGCRLICFHYAGGNASVFRQWADGLPEQIEVLAVQLPGHGSRYAEPLMLDFAAIVHAIATEIRRLDNIPCYLFGHSMGALMAFEVASVLMHTEVLLKHLMVSAALPPHVKRESLRLSTLTDRELVKELRAYDGTSEEILDNPDLVRLLLPVWRADFMIAESCQTAARAPLTCPLTTFHGSDDKWISESDIGEWRQLTRAAFSARVFDGGHFFLHSREEELLRVIAALICEQEDIYAALD